jgi:nucleotide-binding universal stress UspA family protein
MFKHILLATDGSAASENAARLGASLAQVHGSRLTAVYVVDPYPYLGLGEANPMGFQAYMSAAMDHAAAAQTKVSNICAEAKVPLEVLTVEEVAATEGILRTADDVGADLIVVGSHGRTGVSRLLVGSIAAKVVAHAKVPVLVTRMPAGLVA